LPARFFLAALIAATFCLAPQAARADADEAPTTPSSLLQGLQPITGPIPVATPAPGESRLLARPDGSYQAVPEVRGRTKIFHIVERAAPWTLKPGLTVMANTYNGVVPGPALVVAQGDTVVIDYRNQDAAPDTIHLHGIRGAPDTMDGVPGISQALVPAGGSFRYEFVANQAGTFIYHTHGQESMLNSGLYGAVIVNSPNPPADERGLAHDFLEIISSWQIQSGAENEFTLNGKEYPSTRPLEVRAGERFLIRWINISGEEFHTMHTHGHDQLVVERDARPVTPPELLDTLLLGPGQRADVVVTANAVPGTWLIHCHVGDHVEDAQGMPDGLITAIHYAGTPNTFGSMRAAMMPAVKVSQGGAKPLDFRTTVLLGAIAGFTIFLGLPIARARRVSKKMMALLNALAIGILVYLVIEIAQNATGPVTQAVTAWRAGSSGFPVALTAALVGGFFLGLVGLGSVASQMTKRAASQADNPLLLSLIIAVGIGAHNFGEGLAIGASAASGATAVAAALIIGFALHNATEGFGVAAPLVGRVIPTWGQIGLAGLIAGGPTFIGTIVGYQFYSPVLAVFFLATAAGALIFVIGELWSMLRKIGIGALVTTAMTAGFLVAFATEVFLDSSGG
jgi:zinc transporter, ZIP family